MEQTIITMSFPITISLVILTCFFFFLVSKKKIARISQLPPGPWAWGLVCDIFPFGKEYHLWFANLARTHGELMSLRLGHKLVVVASSVATATEILKTQDSSFHGKYIPAILMKIPHIADSSIIFGANLKSWKMLRSICHTQLFSVKAIASQTKMREEKVNDTVKYLRVKQNQVVKMENLLSAVIVNIVSNLAVSRDLVDIKDETENGKMKERVNQLLRPVSMAGLGDVHSMLSGIDMWSSTRAMTLRKEIKSLWGDIVSERRRDHPRQIGEGLRGDLLDVLIENSFDDLKIYIFLTELLLGGITSSQATSEWLMIELVKNKEVMRELREEFASVLKQADLTEEHLPHLPFLQACVKETLRLHHPSPLTTPHRALETCRVMDHLVPKGSLAIVNFWAVGRDPLIWDDPSEFKPHRFLGSNREFRGNQSEFMPFGAGRRICPGLPLAVKQIPLLVGSLLHCFDWTLPAGVDPKRLGAEERFGLVVSPKDTLFLIPTARSPLAH